MTGISGQHLKQLGNAINQQDAETARRLAHLIKGSMMTLAVPTVEESAQQLESLCATGDLTHAQDCFSKLEPQLKQVNAILAEFVEKK